MKNEVIIVPQISVIPVDKMFFSMDELKGLGFSNYKIQQMVGAGILAKLNKKCYENLKYQGEKDDFYYAYAYVPAGVVCLLSAAVYYNLSTYRPDEVDVAIKRKARVSTLPDWPEIHLYHYTDERFELGVETVSDGKNQFRIYDMEKTVVDIIFYRDRVGIEETKEILVNYLERKERNLNRLVRYAETMKCGQVLKKYLEVLV